MRPRWIVLVLFIVVLLSSCIQKPAVKPTDSKDQEFYYGYRLLPEEFLNYWFENLEKIKNGELNPIVFEGSAGSKLIVNSSQIAQTQIVLSQPEIEVIPSKYLANHTPPKNQHPNGTCWAFTTAGSLESALLTQLSYSERLSLYPFLDLENPDLSEQFIAYYNVDYWMEQPFGGIRITCQETNQDIGGNIFFSTYNLIRRGVPPEDDFPYITEKQVWIKWNALNNDWKWELVRSYGTVFIRNYQSFSDDSISYEDYIKTIKSAIMKYGALAVGFQVYEDFDSIYWQGTGSTYGKVYVHQTGESSGGHAVLLVGWVDNYFDPISGYSGPIWVMKNSWGTSGGHSLDDYGLSSDTTKGYFAFPMISEDEYNNGNCPDWKIECSGMAVPLLRAAQQSYALQASDKLLTAGRIGYLDVKVLDDQGGPASGVRVKFFARIPPDEEWYPVRDVLTGSEEIETDSNGVARISILHGSHASIDFYVYVVENPSSDFYFTVNVNKPNWFFLVWMCADNNLEEEGVQDLVEMGNINENVSAMTFFDGRSILPDCVFVLDEFGEWQQILIFNEDLGFWGSRQSVKRIGGL
ncbi:MAG: C1 family peptidase [Pseudothermotoga sp.]